MRLVLGLSALGAALGLVAGPLAFVAVGFGLIEATGAPPGGVLDGFFGGLLAFTLHGVVGALVPTLNTWGWVLALAVPFSLIGALRRRCRWWSPIACAIGVLLLYILGQWVASVNNWFGSVSRWDAAAMWGAEAGTSVAMMFQLPLLLTLAWRWANAAEKPLLGSYAVSLRAYQTGAFTYEDRVNVLWLGLNNGFGPIIANTVEVLAFLAMLGFGWHHGGWVGGIIALFFGAMWGSLATSLIGMVAGMTAAVAVMLPLATLIAVWWRESAAARETLKVTGLESFDQTA